MGGGNGNPKAAAASRRLRRGRLHDHLRNNAGETADIVLTAWDQAPPVIAPLNYWKPREFRYRTPQHLVSLSARTPLMSPTWSAPPLLLKERFLIAPTATGQIFIWDLVVIVESAHDSAMSFGDEKQQTLSRADEADAANLDPIRFGYARSNQSEGPGLSAFRIQTATSPTLVVETNTPESSLFLEGNIASAGSSLVFLSLAPTVSLLANGSQRQTLVGISVVGIVHVIELQHARNERDTVDTDSRSTSSSPPLRAAVQHSWCTGSTGMHCVTVTQQGLIVIGYNSGFVEAWRIVVQEEVETTSSSGKSDQQKQAPSVSSADGAASESLIFYKETLVWRAAFDHVPIVRSVIELRSQAKAKTNNIDDSVEAGNESTDDYIAMTLQNESRTSTGSMIEVVNISSLQRAWKESPCPQDELAFSLPFEDHSILPQAGMEIVSSLAIRDKIGPQNSRFLPQWIPSNGTDCLCSITMSDSVSTGDIVVSCAAALADGAVLLLSSSTLTPDGTLEWGIQFPGDQILLSYPAVGIGLVPSYSTRSEAEPGPHIACCLRGGTTYLIPIHARDGSQASLLEVDPPISVVMYPHDIDADIDFQRIQGFVAGQLSMTGMPMRRFTQETIPVLIYAWPGGIIDIYAAELLHNTDASASALLEELVLNGSAELLRTYLTTVSPKEDLQRQEWKYAQEEIQRWSPTGLLSVSDLASKELQAFRSVLLSVA
jgi:hypothetical protein